jgi:hypothetical protein
MVLLLADADDPEAKLALPTTGVIRVTSVEDSDDDESTVQLLQDSPPSYADIRVQEFRSSRTKTEGTRRAKRRFCFALGIALLLCSLLAISAISFSYYQASDVTTPDVSATWAILASSAAIARTDISIDSSHGIHQ